MEKLNYILIILLIFLLMGGIALFIFKKENSKLKNENELYIVILKADRELSLNSLDTQKANSYYSEAGFFYEIGEYKLVESNCRLARDHYSKGSQGYKNIKADLLNSGVKDRLINIYIDSLDSAIEFENSLYEACEHFEVASRYYDKYYNTNVPYDDPSYDMGTGEIDKMNEKIEIHDKAIERYNQYIEDFVVELESRIEGEK